MLTQDVILNALKSVKYPGFSRDIVSFGIVKQAEADGGNIKVQLQLTTANAPVALQLKAECTKALTGLPGVTGISVEVLAPQTPGAPTPASNRVVGISGVHLRIKRRDFYRHVHDRKQLRVLAERIGPAAGLRRKSFK